MKTFNFKAIIFSAILMFLFTKNLSSQIIPINTPFGIGNTLNCDVIGTWAVTQLTGTCGISFCDSGTFTVSAQSLLHLPLFSGCTPDNEVECIVITITDIGGQSVNFTINSNSISLNTQYSLNNIAPGCTAPASYYMMDNTTLHLVP